MHRKTIARPKAGKRWDVTPGRTDFSLNEPVWISQEGSITTLGDFIGALDRNLDNAVKDADAAEQLSRFSEFERAVILLNKKHRFGWEEIAQIFELKVIDFTQPIKRDLTAREKRRITAALKGTLWRQKGRKASRGRGH